MSSPTADNLASRLRQVRRLSRAQRSMVDGSARALVVVAFAVPMITLVVSVLVVLSVLLLAGSGIAGVGPATGAVWLAIHQVPVTISGVTIGVLPLLPTLIIGAASARMAASAAASKRSGAELIAVFCSAIGGPMLITALSLAVIMDGSSVLPIQSPLPLTAFAYTLGIHGGAAALGILWSRRRDCYERFGVPRSVRRGVRGGAIAVVALLTCGAVVVVVRIVQRWDVIGELIAGGHDFDGYLGLTGLSVLYLPNLVVGAAGILIGTDVHIGTASVDLLDVQAGPLPPLPILGLLPESGLGTWGVIGFGIPLAIAVVVAVRCRDLDPLANVRSVAVAGAVAASTMVLLATMAGGALGEFGDARITVPTLGVFTLGWIVVVGLVVALVYGVLPSTRAARRFGVDEFDDDLDEYGYADDYLTDEYDDRDDEYDYGDADWETDEIEEPAGDEPDGVGVSDPIEAGGPADLDLDEVEYSSDHH
ncbi:cell division protein PerM [Gordonia rhizosphera]|uniref:Uncharacterized protein n=1 Tax=Gordonia rhizosphera NBRC 16068 TaxID=1108045 RepID=K6W6T9_9ACTN|nr:DUF6350 family protein [Gordonia rhizosphera]GAB89436.1 hypothetical protein GORHZ_062_00100 [Gordonia rhizosphera NBRC 16068]